MLRADDNGQGGAFALFSLLKRQAELGKKSKVGLLSWVGIDALAGGAFQCPAGCLALSCCRL